MRSLTGKSQGMVSLRSVQKAKTLLRAGALATTLLAVGCSQPAAAPTSAPIGQETPQRGGVLEMAFNIAEPAHLDPLRSVLAGTSLIGKTYSGLLQFDPIENTKIVGELAERWEISADAKTYTFYLHNGVKWHDGAPFSAEDVKYTYDRIRDTNDRQAIDLNSRRGLFEAVKNIEAPDATTLRINLNRPSNSLLGSLAWGPMLIIPKHAEGTTIDLSKDVLGTGAFKLKNYQRGAVFQVERNPDYFIKDRPYLDAVNVYLLKDLSTRIAAFSTGQIKLLSEVYANDVAQAKQSVPDLVVSKKSALRNGILSLHNEKSPFNDIKVRKALHLALDRQAALAVLVPGEGKLGTLLDPDGSQFSQDELAKLPGYRADKTQDLAEAKKLLAEAGYPNGFKTSINASAGSQDYEALAIFAKDQLRKLGIDLTINIKPATAATSDRDLGNYEMESTVAVLYYPDPSAGSTYYGADNYMRFKDPAFHDLRVKQDATTNPEERKKLIRQMEERWLDQVPYVVLYWKDHSAIAYPEVKGYEIGVGIYGTMRFTGVWLAR